MVMYKWLLRIVNATEIYHMQMYNGIMVKL